MAGRAETKVATRPPQFRPAHAVTAYKPAPAARRAPVTIAASVERKGKERFTDFDGGFGSDQDWPVGRAPIDITVPRLAVARTIEEVGMRNTRGKGIDVHELLKREAFGSPNDLCDNHFEKSRPCPDATYGISDQYMTLDSFEMIEESRPQKGVLKWNFMVQGVTGNQRIGVKDKMDTIIEMQIGCFCIPQPLPVPYVVNPSDGASTLALPVLTSNSSPTLTAFVPAGVYAPAAAATALQNAINSVPGVSGFTVTYDATTELFTIARGASPFSILWETGPHGPIESPPTGTNCATPFGFPEVDMTGNFTYTGTTPVPVNVTIVAGISDAFDFSLDTPLSSDSLTSPLTQIPFCSRVTIQMEEMGLQSYSDRDGARHHFEMDARPSIVQTPDGSVFEDMLTLKPACDWDTFIFTDPIKSVDGLTLIFRNPDIPLSLPPSCLFGVQAQVSSAGQFLQFDTTTPNGLSAGDRVFITGFSSGNIVIDQYVNRKQGQVVGINGLTTNTFRLDPDVGTATLGLPLGAPIRPPNNIFSILWKTGPSAATSCRSLFAFNDVDDVGRPSYTSDSTFALLWSPVPNPNSANVALGFRRVDIANGTSYTGILPVSLLWGSGPNSATSIRQHLSLPLQNMQGNTKYSSGTFSILWTGGSASCRGLFGFGPPNSAGSNSYTGTVQIPSEVGQFVTGSIVQFDPVTGRPITTFQETTAVYTVSASNNKFDFSTGGPTITAAIAVGTYTAPDLATALQTAINAVSDGFTVTYNATTSLYTIARPGPFVVTAGVNDAFDFQVASGPILTAFVPAGTYAGATFAAALQTAITALASPFSDGFLISFIAASSTFTISRGGGRFTITAGVNDGIAFNDGIAHVVTIPAGVYTGTALAVAAQVAMNGASFGYRAQFDPKTSRVTISRLIPVPRTQALTVVAGVNDSYDWMETSVKSIQLTAGTYTPVTLAKQLEDELNGASSGYNVVYDPDTGKFTISRRHFPPVAQTMVCIAKNRIRIPLRLRRVVQRLTNYISP